MSAVIELLHELVGIESCYPNEQKISRFLETKLSAAGFTVETVTTGADRNNLVATWGQAKRHLGFYGHIDTVPPARDYARNPFAVDRQGDVLRGLGVCDMKGGVAALIQAGFWAREKNLPIKLVFGVDEEDISQGAHDLCSSGLLSDIAFLVVAESGQVTDFNQPVSVCLGRRGRIVLDVTVFGRAAHAAEAHRGINAISQASRLVQAADAISFASHPRLGATSLVWQSVAGESNAFSVPDRCDLRCSLLTSPGDSSASLIKRLSDSAQKLEMEVSIAPHPRPTPYGEAYELDLTNPFWQTIRSKILEPRGVQPIYTPSVADENVFAARLGIPVLTIGPIGAGDHTKDEWVKASSIEELVRVFQEVIALWSTQAHTPR